MDHEGITGWASRDPGARWGAGAAVAVLWTAVAWAEARMLLGLPLVGAVLAFLYHRRRDVVDVAEDDEWL